MFTAQSISRFDNEGREPPMCSPLYEGVLLYSSAKLEVWNLYPMIIDANLCTSTSSTISPVFWVTRDKFVVLTCSPHMSKKPAPNHCDHLCPVYPFRYSFSQIVDFYTRKGIREEGSWNPPLLLVVNSLWMSLEESHRDPLRYSQPSKH